MFSGVTGCGGQVVIGAQSKSLGQFALKEKATDENTGSNPDGGS
jgi:hypothetical protein